MVKHLDQKALKKAIREHAKLLKCGLYARIYANRNTGEIWCEEFVSESDYSDYGDSGIVELPKLYENQNIDDKVKECNNYFEKEFGQ